MEWLQGKKTYIVSALMVLASLVQLVTGDLSITQFFSSPDLMFLLGGLGIGTLRAGVSKATK